MLILSDKEETNLKVTMKKSFDDKGMIRIYYGLIHVGSIATDTGKFRSHPIIPAERIKLESAGVELEIRDGYPRIKIS